jgi:hypothetical protein
MRRTHLQLLGILAKEPGKKAHLLQLSLKCRGRSFAETGSGWQSFLASEFPAVRGRMSAQERESVLRTPIPFLLLRRFRAAGSEKKA